MKSMPRFGVHCSIAGGLHKALTEGQELGCKSIQLFVANQRQWKHPPLTDQQILTFKTTREETGIDPIVAHSSYLINLGATVPDTYQKSLIALADELDRCDRLGIEYLVMHPGSHLGQGVKAGISQIAQSLANVLNQIQPENTIILLETTAGQGTNLGYRFEQLAEIINQTGMEDYLGVCLDTCHIFAAGYDFSTPQKCGEVFGAFDSTIGLNRLKVIHVNDSKTEFGQNKDRHEHIGQGKIGTKALSYLLKQSEPMDLTYILETPKDVTPDGINYDRINLELLRKLFKSAKKSS